MRSRALAILVSLMLVAGFGLYVATLQSSIPVSAFNSRAPNLKNGETIYHIGGCASCHGAQPNPESNLAGGLALRSPFGTFRVPNISSDRAHGIGAWTEQEFANAILRGVGRSGEHLYPSFPYTSYQRMALDDVRDLYAFLKTLPAVATPSLQHELGFPFNVRRGVGLWKLLFLTPKPVAFSAPGGSSIERGAYLVDGPGHCAECHSGRNIFGAIKSSERFAGGPNLQGKGWVPNITPHADGLASWSLKDIEFFLETGIDPDGASVSGEMAEVIRNVSKLAPDDRRAMAAYLKALPPRPGRKPTMTPVAN
jgi:mono/diheme cytochrome c family protein